MTWRSKFAWMILLSVIKLCELQVIIEPPGPLYLPISTQRNITCSIEGVEGRQLNIFVILFSDINPITSFITEGKVIQGIDITFVSQSRARALISINTDNTSIIGLRFGSLTASRIVEETILNLTVYGVPDPPTNISLSLEGNSLRSSWVYVRIPTVDVTLYWSLSFFTPSQLSNMTSTLLNTNTYNYTLQGARSCDPFRLCIRAENVVGNSFWSCSDNMLPYLPQREDIEYSLVQVNEAFSLNVTVMVHQECQSLLNTYCLNVTSAEGNKVAMSPCVRSDDESIHFLVENLMWNTSYNISITSNNNLGPLSTAVMSFYTNNVESVDICSLADEQVYEISCRYVSGAVRTGCAYQLTGTDSTIISIQLIGEEYALHKASDVNCCYNNIIVQNSDGYVVTSGPFNTFSITPCQATTTATVTAASASTDSTKCSGNVSGLPIIITMGAIICAQIILCLMTPFITIFIYKKFFINPFMQKGNRSSPTSQKVLKKMIKNYKFKDCSENPAYGIMPLSSLSPSQNRGKTNVIPEYEVVDLETKEASS